jgi:hypothetical protein
MCGMWCAMRPAEIVSGWIFRSLRKLRSPGPLDRRTNQSYSVPQQFGTEPFAAFIDSVGAAVFWCKFVSSVIPSLCYNFKDWK